jgi:hypothetical protein
MYCTGIRSIDKVDAEPVKQQAAENKIRKRPAQQIEIVSQKLRSL